MKAVSKKLLSLMLVAILLVSAVPFQASATETQPAETVAATEAAVAAVAETEVNIEANAPAAQEAVELEKDRVKVHFQLGGEYGNIQVGSIASSKLGSKVSGIPSGSAAEKVLAQVIGSNTGYEFVRWYYETNGGDAKTFNSNVYLNMENMDLSETGEDSKGEYYILNVFAEFHMAKETITLKPNGGTVKNSSYDVVVGEPYGELPTPKREHYTFEGWYKTGDVTKTPIEDDTIVEDLTSLTANWSKSQYTVYIELYTDTEGTDNSGWDTALEVTVPALSTLSVKDDTFVTEDDVELEDWSVDGWIIKESGKDFVPGKTQITEDGMIIRPVYKKNITLHANDEGHTTRKLTVTLGKKLPTLPNPGSRDELVFMGWYDADENFFVPRAELADVSKHPTYYPGLGDLYAAWRPAAKIKLYIHVDGDTEDPVKVVNYFEAPATGFDLTEIDLAEIFASYGKYDDEGDQRFGWYDAAQWDNYCLKKPANEFEYVSEEYLEEDDIHSFYIMLIDKGNNSSASNNAASGAGSGYNDTSKVDPSNPATGDNIVMTVSVMTASAAALALVFFLNKKRAAI